MQEIRSLRSVILKPSREIIRGITTNKKSAEPGGFFMIPSEWIG